MTANAQNQRISREAAMLAIEWKAKFASELQNFALRAGQDSDIVTAEHFREAIPEALQAMLHSVDIETAPTDAKRKAA